MMSPDDFLRLSKAGLTPEQIALVMEIMTREANAAAAKEEDRKAKARERWHRWNALLNMPRGDWASLSAAVKRRDNYKCVYCGSQEEPLHCDHIIPLSQGGTSDPHNLVTACRACNCGKSGRTVEQWRGRL